MDNTKKPNTFVFYRDWAEMIGALTDAEALYFYRAISAHAFGGTLEQPEQMPDRFKLAYLQTICRTIDSDKLKYSEKCQKLAKNRLGKGKKQLKSIENNCNQLGSDNVNDNDNGICNDTINHGIIYGDTLLHALGTDAALQQAWRQLGLSVKGTLQRQGKDITIDYSGTQEGNGLLCSTDEKAYRTLLDIEQAEGKGKAVTLDDAYIAACCTIDQVLGYLEDDAHTEGATDSQIEKAQEYWGKVKVDRQTLYCYCKMLLEHGKLTGIGLGKHVGRSAYLLGLKAKGYMKPPSLLWIAEHASDILEGKYQDLPDDVN